MHNGTIKGSNTSGIYGNIESKIEWSAVPMSKTQTRISAKLYYKISDYPPPTTYKDQGSFYITIAGDRSSVTNSKLSIAANEWFLAYEASSTILNSRYDDPAKVEITGGGELNNLLGYLPTVSGYAEFDLHNGETVIDSISCSTAYFDGDIDCKYTAYDGSLYVKCDIALIIGDTSTAITTTYLGREYIGTQSKVQNTKQINLSKEDLATIYNKLPSSTSGKLRFTFVSYRDNDYKRVVGSSHYKEITLSIPSNDSTQPTATMTLSPYNTLPSPFNGMYINGLSKVAATFTNSEGKYGATIESIKMTMLGKTYSAPYISDYIPYEGDIVVKGIITDSRGISRTYTETINCLSYSIPIVIPTSGNYKIICDRCDDNGTLSDSGTYLKIVAKRSFSPVFHNGVQTNFCQIRYRYKDEKESYSDWSIILDDKSTSDEVDTGALLSVELDNAKSYVVQIGAFDTIGNSDTVTIFISTAKVYIHKAASRNSFGIGTYVKDDEENVIAIGEDMNVVFRGEKWTSLELLNGIQSTEDIGRHGGTGCYYRVCEGGKHVYVAFNRKLNYDGSPIQINLNAIPSAFRPKRSVYTMCATSVRAAARVNVNTEGNVIVDWIQLITSSAQTTSTMVGWIDGYIDYWIE